MSARRQIIAALSEDSLGGIATMEDVARAEQLADAHRAEVLAEREPKLLTTARAAVAPLIAHDTGDRPRWRVIHTDSESPSGVALTCTGERSDALHMIDDYPGGPIRDEEGVYDCCPWPQFETYSPVLAAYLVALLNADVEEKATDVQSATAAPFFQPGHTYTRQTHGDTTEFRVDHIATAPDSDYRRAYGWYRAEPGTRWHGYFADESEFDGWTDVTEAGDRS